MVLKISYNSENVSFLKRGVPPGEGGGVGVGVGGTKQSFVGGGWVYRFNPLRFTHFLHIPSFDK